MTVTVKNMTCSHCVKTITMALLKEKIVSKIDLNKQTVTTNDNISKEKVIQILSSVGYDAT